MLFFHFPHRALLRQSPLRPGDGEPSFELLLIPMDLVLEEPAEGGSLSELTLRLLGLISKLRLAKAATLAHALGLLADALQALAERRSGLRCLREKSLRRSAAETWARAKRPG